MWLPPLAAAMRGWSPWAWKPATSEHSSLFGHVLGCATWLVGILLNKLVVQQFDTVASEFNLIAGYCHCTHVLAHGCLQVCEPIQHSLVGSVLLVFEQLVCVRACVTKKSAFVGACVSTCMCNWKYEYISVCVCARWLGVRACKRACVPVYHGFGRVCVCARKDVAGFECVCPKQCPPRGAWCGCHATGQSWPQHWLTW